MGRAPCCDKASKVKKGPWTPDEDIKLVEYIQQHGHGSWRALPEKAGLARCGKSCRLRWTNYLRPGIKRGRFSHEEEQTIFQLHAILGNRWSAIASRLPRRTDNEIKNYWNTHLKKRLITQVGLGPFSSPAPASSLQELLTSAWATLTSVPTRLTHMTQWDLTVADAQARLRPKPSDQSDNDDDKAQEAGKLHPSAFFMRTWKTEAELTPLRRESPARVLGAQSWVPMTEVAALDFQLDGSLPVTEDSGEDEYSGSVFDGFAALGPHTGRGGAGEDGSEDGRSGICSGSVLGDPISADSIWNGPESCSDGHYGSPCHSTNSGTTSADCFHSILHQSSGFHKLPVILLEQPGDSEPSRKFGSTTSTADEDTFWEDEQSADQLMEAMQPAASCTTVLLGDAGSESIIPLEFDETEFGPQFESLCREAIWGLSSSCRPGSVTN